MSEIVLLHHNEPMTTSMAISEGVGMAHASVIKLVRKYVEALSGFGRVGFEIQPVAADVNSGFKIQNPRSRQGRPTEFAYLNEPQATLLLTFMRNSEVVVKFKVALVKEFYEMRSKLALTLDRAAPCASFPSHEADRTVVAQRTFNAVLRAARAATVPLPQALRRANEEAKRTTGIDMLALTGGEARVIEMELAQTSVKGRLRDQDVDQGQLHTFWSWWSGGQEKIPFGPCLMSDLYTAYLRWCAAHSCAPQRLTTASAVWKRQKQADIRVRWWNKNGTPVQNTVVVPDKATLPTIDIQGWLTSSITRFSAALEKLD